MKSPLFCIFDDRPEAETGIRLLIGSLKKANRSARLCVFFDPASQAFRHWIDTLSDVELRATPFPTGLGWDTKPHALIELLETGEDQVVWLDSDIIVTHDPEPLFANAPEDTLCITEDALWGSYEDAEGLRAKAWGFTVTRPFGHSLNTCVVRVTPAHLPLLKTWLACLNQSEYKCAQQTFWADRPDHLFGDQDVITALLTSNYGAVPVQILRRGNEIIQAFGLKGYTLRERFGNLYNGLPVFIHAQGFKPWRRHRERWIAQVYFDVSPYVLAALQNIDALDETEGQARFFEPKTGAGALLRYIGFGSIPVSGMPMAAAFDLTYGLSDMIKRLLERLAPR